jgi:hypothetical protein
MKIAFTLYAGFKKFDKPAISQKHVGYAIIKQVHLAMYLVTGQYQRYLLYLDSLPLLTRKTQGNKRL